jgi:hypothetical protein
MVPLPVFLLFFNEYFMSKEQHEFTNSQIRGGNSRDLDNILSVKEWYMLPCTWPFPRS